MSELLKIDAHIHDKEYYEIEKLKAEIKQIKKPGYSKLAFYQFLSTTILALCSLVLLVKNGAFDLKSLELDAKRERLELAIAKDEARRDSLQKELLKLHEMTFQLTKLKRVMSDSLVKTTDAYAALLNEYERLYLNTEIKQYVNRTGRDVASSATGSMTTGSSEGALILDAEKPQVPVDTNGKILTRPSIFMRPYYRRHQ